MKPSWQDKLCNGLTLVGLLGVIGWGVSSLLPEDAQPAPADVTSREETPEEEPTALDTLREIPMVEDQPEPVAVKEDSLRNDTLPQAVTDSLLLHPGEAPRHEEQHAAAPDTHKVVSHSQPSVPDGSHEKADTTAGHP